MASNKKTHLKINNLTRIVLLSLAGLLVLSFQTDGMGQLGLIIDNSFSLLLGNSKIILPLVLAFVGICTYNSKKKSDTTALISGVVIILIAACFLDLRSLRPGVYNNRFFYGMSQSRLGINGGLIGAFTNSIFIHLIGVIGLYILLVVGLVISIILMFDISYQDILHGSKKGAGVVRTGLSSGKTWIKKGSSNIREKISNRRRLKKSGSQQTLDLEDYPQPKEREVELLSSQGVFDDSTTKIKKQSDHTPSEPVIRTYDENMEEEKLVQTRESRLKESEKKEVEEEISKAGAEIIEYEKPPLSLLKKNTSGQPVDREEIKKKVKAIEDTMANFGIEAHVSQVNTGPTITSYEMVPEPGVKLSRIVNLSDNLAFSLASSGIRIEAPIPGKSAVGIEVPNDIKSMVSLEEVLNSDQFKNYDGDLPLVLGKDVTGKVVISSIDSMPHLLIAGATGSGKSVAINSIILSLIYKTSPRDLRLILIDPKIVELGIYNSLPHLLIPVVTNPRKAASTLAWAVEEMERRYKKFSENYVRDIKGYNEKFKDTDEKMPKIVIIIDELADLMMVSSTEVEDYISRLAQMARAAGMHLILATQRPSVDVITGTIKANIPSRISFAVSSGVDSRTILDTQGAEKLLGQGDMLFFPSSYSKPKRIQGSFVSQGEIDKIVDYFKDKDYGVDTHEEILDEIETVKEEIEQKEDMDPLFMEALKLAVYEEQASISYLQRRLRIGYSRAARIVDQMEARNMVGPSNGPKPRDIYITEEDYLRLLGDD